MLLLLLIQLQLTLGDLVPGNQVNFVSRGGYKYIGVPEVDKHYPNMKLYDSNLVKSQHNITLPSGVDKGIVCSHHCMLTPGCSGYFVNGEVTAALNTGCNM